MKATNDSHLIQIVFVVFSDLFFFKWRPAMKNNVISTYEKNGYLDMAFLKQKYSFHCKNLTLKIMNFVLRNASTGRCLYKIKATFSKCASFVLQRKLLTTTPAKDSQYENNLSKLWTVEDKLGRGTSFIEQFLDYLCISIIT